MIWSRTFANKISPRFGLLNMKIALAMTLMKYKLSLDTSKTLVPLRFDPKFTLIQPVGGFWVKFDKLEEELSTL